jgi:hypothetical protein
LILKYQLFDFDQTILTVQSWMLCSQSKTTLTGHKSIPPYQPGCLLCFISYIYKIDKTRFLCSFIKNLMVKKITLIHSFTYFFNTLPTFIFQIHITCWMSPVGTTRAHKLIYRQYLNVWFLFFGCWGKIQWSE